MLYRQVEKPETDVKATHRWLMDGKLQAEMEAIIIVAKDGVTHTATYKQS